MQEKEKKSIDRFGTVLLAGKILLSSGAEIYRAEETMHRLAETMHIEDMDAYVMNRGIFATAKVPEEGIETRIVSVPDKEMDIEKIEEVNELSRTVCSGALNIENLLLSLRKIADKNSYSLYGRLSSYFLGAAGFSYAIGTSVRDSFCAGVVGSLIGLFSLYARDHIKSRVLGTILGSILTALLSNLLIVLGLGRELSFIILGVMMDLVPGVAFVNSVREFSQNNFATGGTLLISLISTAISDISRISNTVLLLRSLAAGIGTVGFAIMVHVRKRHFLVCGELGAVTWFVYIFILKLQYNEVIAVFVSGFLAVLASRIFAVFRKCPATVFLMTSLIPLLPGISLYRAIYYFFMGNTETALHFAKICSYTAFTIAVSIAIVQQIPRSWKILK